MLCENTINKTFTEQEIKQKTDFIEKYFESVIIY